MALSRDAGQFPGSAGPFAGRLRAGRLVLGAVASTAFIAVFLSVVDTSDFERSVTLIPERPGIVALLAIAYTAAFALRSIAWRLLLSQRIEAGRLFSILQASLFINHVMPFKAGEVARPYFAVRHGVPVAEAASTTVVARLLDFAALALIATLALPLGALSPAAGIALFGASFTILSGGLALLWLRHSVPAFLPDVVQLPLERAQAALRQIRAPHLGMAGVLVVSSWLLEGTILYGAAQLLNVDVTLQMAVAATAFTILFQVIHITPGGLGVYETSMTSILALQGVSPESALTLAVVTHGLKFAYSFAVGGPFFAVEAVGALRGTRSQLKTASKLEIVVARGWNVINEGKPFTPVFTLTILLLLSLPKVVEPSYWPGFLAALLVMTPLGLLFFRFDFPLRLRWTLWVYLAAILLVFQTIDLAAVVAVVSLYLIFTVFVWGTVYYHLRIGTRWTNFLRFWRLVLENPDPTSGNLQEQLPKVLILVMAVRMLAGDFSATNVIGIELFTAAVGVTALLVHQWFFTWVPALPQPLAERSHAAGERMSKRFVAIVIDGCRADRLREANTPFINKLRAEGTEYTNVATVYPARTVTCFSSMLTGVAPAVHGMRSNFVPSLGVKSDSIFRSLERGGLNGKLVGIAHLIDAFGHEDVRSVTAVMHNDEIDDGLVARGKEVVTNEAPDLLVLQLLSVDQTGHARGSYNDEYLRKIEVTDQKIEEFLGWCEARGYLDDATVLITA
ncbi:MAG: lysylphosphatidylglycerol synthase domain-containing protein, partial [Dehalococcoidia bacterium]